MKVYKKNDCYFLFDGRHYTPCRVVTADTRVKETENGYDVYQTIIFVCINCGQRIGEATRKVRTIDRETFERLTEPLAIW